MCTTPTHIAADNVRSIPLLRPPLLMASSDGAQVDAATLAGAKPRVLVSQRYTAIDSNHEFSYAHSAELLQLVADRRLQQ
jgi:hypothetical protein